MFHVGYCISAHGYGHAARAAAVMEALAGFVDVRFTILTKVPRWFFRSSLSASFTVHPVQIDVGLVQQSALETDLPATVRTLNSFYAGDIKILPKLSRLLTGCHLVISDIAPVGLAAAYEAGIPSVLIENFTWDWIYENYLAAYPGFQPYILRIKEMNALAKYRIQTEPVCKKRRCDLLAAPIARKIRSSREQIRRQLGVRHDDRLVLVSMGGEGIRQVPATIIDRCPDIIFLVSGPKSRIAERKNLRILPPDSDFFHPDLVAAVDAVVGKVGYSTLAEVYHAGVPLGYIRRPDFRESGPLVSFIEQNLAGIEIQAEDFAGGSWNDVLPRLFALPGKKSLPVNGADQCAGFLAGLLRSPGP
ncbi:MAG: hypothetical protein SCH71_10075 [Desulfobulbaceae bacterium]|nr:hypothetical protein [Desulfobulbaceae bacterium]